MKVGILGSGVVGKALAVGFAKHGHEVLIGSRTPSSLAEWVSNHEEIATGTFADVAIFGDAIVLAVKGTAAMDALGLAGEPNLSGKTIIDATNPIADSPPENGVLKYFTDMNESLMELLQREFPYARFVKAFNSVGYACMVDPSFDGGRPTMFICGNDDAAKDTVRRVLDQFGWETADMGKAEAARAIEPLAILLCIPGLLANDWTHAFKFLGSA